MIILNLIYTNIQFYSSKNKFYLICLKVRVMDLETFRSSPKNNLYSKEYIPVSMIKFNMIFNLLWNKYKNSPTPNLYEKAQPQLSTLPADISNKKEYGPVKKHANHYDNSCAIIITQYV